MSLIADERREVGIVYKDTLYTAIKWYEYLSADELNWYAQVFYPPTAGQPKTEMHTYDLGAEGVPTEAQFSEDDDGNVIEGNGTVEKTAFFIHGAAHRQCPHATTILHTHMPYATAVACTEGGLDETLSQNSLFFYKKVSYESFGGVANHRAEGE